MTQPSLFPDPQALKSRVISRRKDFEVLFEGFTRLRGVSYVASPELLLEFLERHGYESVEMVVGENLSEPYRQTLAQKGAETTARLAELVAAGKLRILIPERTLHTKLYLLEKPDGRRVVVTSANFTETARSAAKQVNYAWYADLPAGHPWLAQVERDYEAHASGCKSFLGDLAELWRKEPEAKRKELVETWLRGVPAEEVDLEARRFLQEIARLATARSDGAAEPVFSVKLPEAPGARKQAERILAPLDPVEAGGEVRLSGAKYLRYIQKAHGLPILRVDRERRELRLGMDDGVEVLSEPPPDAAAVSAGLAHLESYVQTVDLGQAPDPRFAKMGMYEGLIYMLCAPFAHEYMRLKRRRYGVIDSKGPRFLYIYGPSQNGKSTFLRFALRLITGRKIEPAAGGEFTKRKVLGAAQIGTAFPLVFDDLVLSTRQGLFEDVLKSYWESWWSEEAVAPQLVLSSNAYTLKDWAKTRVKRLDFDVQFTPGSGSKEALARLFSAENRVFRWFAHLYFPRLESSEPPSEDELEAGREVFSELYRRAGRPLPDYFPREPIERLYDAGRKEWRALLDRLRKARVAWEADQATVHFTEDMQPYEIMRYENHLPPEVKHLRRGRALVIQSPREFRAWLEAGGPKAGGFWARLLGR